MSNHAGISQASRGRSAFATSSSDFALPFGASRSAARDLSPSTSSNTDANSSAGNAALFRSSASCSSMPISIPSSPSLPFIHSADAHQVHILGSSPSKLVTSATGLGIGNLPSRSARDHANSLSNHFSAQPHSPPLSLAGQGWPPPALTALPTAGSSSSSSPSSSSVTTPAALLRRSQAINSPGFAIASPARFRRASMLGREITPFHLDHDDHYDQQDTSHNIPSVQQDSKSLNTRLNQDPDDGDDEMMQVEDDDAMASRAPSPSVMGPPLSFFSTPSTPPPAASSASSHLPSTRPSLASSALARASASDSGQDSSSSTGGAGLPRAIPPSPSTGPSIGSPLGHTANRSRSSSLLSSNVVRKAVTRRGNLLPKDRSIARVAASLQDECKPEDSEIASEAKLQKRLGGEATLPRTPRFGPSGTTGGGSSSSSISINHGAMRASRSPFFGATATLGTGFSRRKYMWDDDVDDIQGVFTADGLDDGETSDTSSEQEEMMMYYSRTDSLSDEEDHMRSRGVHSSNAMPDAASSSSTAGLANPAAANDASGQVNGVSGNAAANSTTLSTSFGSASATATPGGAGSLPRRKNNALWMGFRDKANAHKWSPSASTGSSGGASSGVFAGERATWRRAGAASGMDLDTSPRVLGAAGSGARLSKRKTTGDDRYEPYKRRAVSPMNLGSSLGTTPTNASFAAAVAAAASSNANAACNNGGGGSNSPLLMPISSPGGGVLYRGVYHHHYTTYASRYSTSPTISRPCTPVNSASTGAGAATIAMTSAIVAMGSFSPAASGSGPGYGSGALGLSISANNPQSMETKMQLEQQEENEALMDEKVGMLGLS